MTIARPPKATRRRSPESQQQFRDELVQQAREIYRTRGYEALTVRAVTEAVGMSPMAFYAYFPTKQALVRHIWLDIFRELFDALLGAGRGARSPLETLRAHAQANLDYWEDHEDHFRMVYLSSADAPGRQSVELDGVPLYVQLLDLLRERVVGCVGERPTSEAELQLLVDLVRTKLFGYLFTTIAVRRYALVDKAALKSLVIDDIVQTVGRAARQAGPGGPVWAS